MLRAEGELLSKISENSKGRERGTFGTRQEKVREARNIVLGALKGMKACLPRNFQSIKMIFLILYT